ncbi:MAG: hypothetical protein EGS40_13105 [Agathobacter sp.]|nr:hypothetical protein [Agathobacter sp.]MBD9287851.1 hypothetical protein [Agathobacter sp.]MBD9288144.1 hypothetical protein [Agathobacter sp.]
MTYAKACFFLILFYGNGLYFRPCRICFLIAIIFCFGTGTNPHVILLF